jgi:hypothetical protein
MKPNDRVIRIGEYQTLPLRFIVGRVVDSLPAFGQGQVQPEYADPSFELPPFDYSTACLHRSKADPEYSTDVLEYWTHHLSKLGNFLQIRDDPDGERFKRFHSHTELASAIVAGRLKFDPEPMWDMFEWLLRFKYVQEAYRADPKRVIRYADHVESLEKLDKLYPERHKAARIIDRAVRSIAVESASWNELPDPEIKITRTSDRPLKLFFSYSHKDEELRDELQKHLSVLQRNGHIEQWHDRRIGVGTEWKGDIDEHLKTADIILLLISSDFLSSNYCYDIELELAMRRHESGEARVIPVFLRPCDWSGSQFGRLQGAPTDAKPVTVWTNQDEAFTDIAKHIRKAAAQIKNLRSSD